MKEETYTHKHLCSNCGKWETVEYPKGTQTFIRICKNCGCGTSKPI